MFSKIAIVVATLAVFVAANPSGVSGSCNAGTAAYCCNTIQNANSAGGKQLLALIGLLPGDVTGQVGGACSPITAVGAAGNSCSTQPTCCEQNRFNGAVATGCSPINAHA